MREIARSICIGIANLQCRVRADELVVDLVNQNGLVVVVGKAVALLVAVYLAGVDCLGDCGCAVVVGEEDDVDGWSKIAG